MQNAIHNNQTSGNRNFFQSGSLQKQKKISEIINILNRENKMNIGRISMIAKRKIIEIKIRID